MQKNCYAKTKFFFGARYYNSDLSIWISVDPLSDKYPNLSSYTYCADNPVRLVDEDGEAPWDPTNIKQAQQFAKKNNGKFRDVTPYISDVPTPIRTSSSNSIDYRIDSEKNNSVIGTTGTIYVEEEVKAWNSGPFQLKYSGSDDSVKKIEQLNNWKKEFNTKYIIKVITDE